MRHTLFFALLLLVHPAYGFSLHGTPQQGGVLLGQTEPGHQVRLDGRPVPVTPDGYFLLGFGRDAPPSARLEVGNDSQILTIQPRTWDIQRINGLPSAKVSPDPQALARIKAENQLLAERRAVISRESGFRQPWTWPADGPLSGVFGSQRILNGEARAPHSGLDIAAPQGAEVRAMTAGRVSLVHADLYYTGQTILIDHGVGLQSTYAHLSAISVTEGQWVQPGQVIGAVGATGRATGPHLHWGISWLDVRLDPHNVYDLLSRQPFGAAALAPLGGLRLQTSP